MYYADQLSRYIHSLRFEEIPQEIILKAKLCIIDSIGCTIAGSQIETGKILANTIAEISPPPESLLWGFDKKCSLLMGVFINSALANAMDFDDVSFTDGPLTGMHPGATTIPPAFSIGEYLQLGGQKLLEAIVAGYEIQERIGEAIVPSESQIQKIKGQGTFQTFGAMVVTAKLLGLNEKEISNAFGVAGGNAPVASVRKTLTNKEAGTTMVKNNYGMASFNGVLSAFLAKSGFTGPANIFEGETGFWRMIGSDQFFPERLVKELGEKYRILNTAFKPYPCCRYFHSSIDAVLKLMETYHLDAPMIDSILVEAVPYVVENYSKRDPKNFIDAVFSFPLSISLEVLKLPYGLEKHFAENMKNPQVSRIMEKIAIRSLADDPGGEKRTKNYYPTKVTMKVGRETYTIRAEFPLGSPQNPMSIGQLEKKFFYLTEGVLGGKKSHELFGKLENIETIGNIKKEIMDLF